MYCVITADFDKVALGARSLGLTKLLSKVLAKDDNLRLSIKGVLRLPCVRAAANDSLAEATDDGEDDTAGVYSDDFALLPLSKKS